MRFPCPISLRSGAIVTTSVFPRGLQRPGNEFGRIPTETEISPHPFWVDWGLITSNSKQRSIQVLVSLAVAAGLARMIDFYAALGKERVPSPTEEAKTRMIARVAGPGERLDPTKTEE